MKNYLLILWSFIILSACSSGVYKVNNTKSGRAVFVAECTGNTYTSCQKRAAKKCPTGYTTIKRYSEIKTVSQPIYRTRYHTRYYSVSHQGHRYYRPYSQPYTYVAGYTYRDIRVRYLQFFCR